MNLSEESIFNFLEEWGFMVNDHRRGYCDVYPGIVAECDHLVAKCIDNYCSECGQRLVLYD